MSEPQSEPTQRALQRWENEGGAMPKEPAPETRDGLAAGAKNTAGTRPGSQRQDHA